MSLDAHNSKSIHSKYYQELEGNAHRADQLAAELQATQLDLQGTCMPPPLSTMIKPHLDNGQPLCFPCAFIVTLYITILTSTTNHSTLSTETRVREAAYRDQLGRVLEDARVKNAELLESQRQASDGNAQVRLLMVVRQPTYQFDRSQTTYLLTNYLMVVRQPTN